MSSNPNYKATFAILNDIEKQGLIQFNKEHADEEFLQNFIQFKKAFSHSVSELVNKIDSFQTKPEEIIIFTIYSELSYINSHLEMIKKIFKIIINTEVFGKNEKLELGSMIEKICNKIQYSEKLTGSIKGMFLDNFRKAILEQKFLIQKNGELIIYPKDEKKKEHLTIKDLVDNALQVIEIFDAMMDWVNGTSKKEIPDMVKDLTKQVQILDTRLNKLS